ncbi:hypothetical protein [Jutongia sp.]|jgi:hypothetical protein|uniref:hypothetical protein n=1 Tax=Jutongia sp. TaxID=2944204 RepID=UPI0015C06940
MSMLADIEDDIASTYVMEHETEFIEKVRSTIEVQQESEAKSLKNRLSREQKRRKRA